MFVRNTTTYLLIKILLHELGQHKEMLQLPIIKSPRLDSQFNCSIFMSFVFECDGFCEMYHLGGKMSE